MEWAGSEEVTAVGTERKGVDPASTGRNVRVDRYRFMVLGFKVLGIPAPDNRICVSSYRWRSDMCRHRSAIRRGSGSGSGSTVLTNRICVSSYRWRSDIR